MPSGRLVTVELFTVNSRKYDLSLQRTWKAYLFQRSERDIVLEGCFEEEVRHPDLGLIPERTRSIEIFFFDRWYNYFIFYEPTGELRNYYFNVCMSPTVGDSVVEYVDLDIDIIVWPNGLIEVLDIEEFEENSRRYGYPSEVVEIALQTKDEIVAEPMRYIRPILAGI